MRPIESRWSACSLRSPFRCSERHSGAVTVEIVLLIIALLRCGTLEGILLSLFPAALPVGGPHPTAIQEFPLDPHRNIRTESLLRNYMRAAEHDNDCMGQADQRHRVRFGNRGIASQPRCAQVAGYPMKPKGEGQ